MQYRAPHRTPIKTNISSMTHPIYTEPLRTALNRSILLALPDLTGHTAPKN